jgi:hypothetical protein
MGNCNTNAYSTSKVFLCCRSQVTALDQLCKTNGQNINALSSSQFKNYIIDLSCFNATLLYKTSNGQYKINTAALENKLSGYKQTTFCYTVVCDGVGTSYCTTFYSTLGFYVAAEPYFGYNITSFNINKYNEKEYINYKFTPQTLWSYEINYNFRSFYNINNYIETSEGIGYCTGIKNTTGIKMMMPSGIYIGGLGSIFTTLISYKLINSPYTSDSNIYNKRLRIYSIYILKSYYVYYKKINKLIVNDENTKKIIIEKLLNCKQINNKTLGNYIKEIFNNFYTNDSDFSFYLRKLDASIFFIYNIIKKNADEKGILVDDLFLSNFYNLIFDNYIINLYMDTSLINIYFSNITLNILSENYDNILNNWINYIYSSISNPVILTIKYAPLYRSYDELNRNDYIEQILTYSNLESVNEKFIFYRKNIIYYTILSKKYIDSKILPLESQLKLAEKIKKLTFTEEDICKIKSNKNNPDKKCGCGLII